MKHWYQKHRRYRQALALAKTLIRDNLVGDQWEPEPLSSWLVRRLDAAMKKPLVRRRRKAPTPNAQERGDE